MEPDFKGTGGSNAGVYATIPNDTHFSRQWSLNNDGTCNFPSCAGVAENDADIDMPEAWDIIQGDGDIVVAIIDSGCKLDHPEFSGRIWINTDEIPDNGEDDDLNGLVDDWRGWDFVNSDNDPTDDFGHGTNVTGIIGANGNNAMGYAGIDWNCKLMILKGLDDNNSGWVSNWCYAIAYAVDNGANLINMSLGSVSSGALENHISYAIQNNVTVVACMMNTDNNIIYYPAGCTDVIAVGSTDPNDTRSTPFCWDPTPAGGSNFGSHISVVAPGNVIYGLDFQNNNNYDTYWSGTSQAAPHVTGLAALLLAQNPGSTPQQIKSIIENTAQDQVGDPIEDTPGWDQYYGHGRINAHSALTYILPSVNETNHLSFKIFPNPTQGKVLIKTEDNAKMNSEIIISNLLGEVLLKQSSNSGVTSIDLSNQAKGVYIVQFKTDQEISTSKIIIR